jgi:predicted DNA-binding helix-hairpin-helix protein
MKQRYLSIVLTAAVLLLSASLSSAIENKADAPQEAASTAKAPPKTTKGNMSAKHKAAAPIKLVDINTASKAELMKLPGVSAAAADKIIADRPLGSKAWLVSDKILPDITFQAIKHKIVCKLTQKDIDKIMADAKAKAKNKK